MTPPRITVVGSANLDFVVRVPRLPTPGQTVTGGTFMQAFGGKGANQAVAAARAGAEVVMVACLGNDPYADALRSGLLADGIDATHVARHAERPSGAALIMVAADGANCIAVAPGTNDSLTPERVRAASAEIARSAMLVLQLETPPPASLEAIAIARSRGVPVMLNYAPVRGAPIELNVGIDILVVNESEAAELCGLPEVGTANAARTADTLRRRGPGMVVVTLGPDGSWFDDGRAPFAVPAFPVPPVDTTAAGDTFCGALAVALAEGQPLPRAARFASAAAALCVSRPGAQPSIPRRREIDHLLGGDRPASPGGRSCDTLRP